MVDFCREMGLDIPFLDNAARTSKFAASIHPSNVFEYLGLHLYIDQFGNILEPHIDLDNCPDWSHSLAVWDRIYLDDIQSWATVLIVGTARRSVHDYFSRCDSICGAAAELMATYNQANPMTKDIVPGLLCCEKPHDIIPLHYDPTVHASVALHWLDRLPPASRTKDIAIELIAAFLSTNNPLLFHRYMLMNVVNGVIKKRKNYLVSFFVYAMAYEGGVNGGELTRFQASCNLPLLHCKLLENLRFLLAAVDLANSKRPARVGYNGLLAAVRKADGLGPLLAGKFILIASYCGLINNIGWGSYMKVGSPKTRERLEKKYSGFATQEKVNQLIRSIAHQMNIGEHKAEEVICLGLRKMTDKTTCKDAVVQYSSLYFLQKETTGALERMVLDYATKSIRPYKPQPFGCNVRAWAKGDAQQQKSAVVIPSRSNFEANGRRARLLNLKSQNEWPPVVDGDLIKSAIHIGGFFIVHPELPQFDKIKEGNIPKPYAREVMKGRNIVVVIIASSTKSASGNIVCVLILHSKTIFISRFEPLYFSPSKFVRICSASK